MGNKKLKGTDGILNPKEIYCLCCGKKDSSDNYYNSDSLQYKAYGKLPYCKECINEIYQGYLSEYKKLKYAEPEKKAVQRLCMIFDLYYCDKIFESAKKEWVEAKRKFKNDDLVYTAYFMKHAKMYQYRRNNYNTTINDEYKDIKEKQGTMSVFNINDSKNQERVSDAIKIFGSGFSDEDYIWLLDEYENWTSQHECNNKSQEEIFKAICFNRLKAHKANIRGEDTKDLDRTFKDLLDTGRLQPKQNKGDTLSETQSFGTLIEKWEDTDPIPEIDEELKDVDKLGLYLDVFFRGHLAKMMGLKNGKSQFYDEYMKQYTVSKPESDNEDEDDIEGLFGKIFGRTLIKEEDS